MKRRREVRQVELNGLRALLLLTINAIIGTGFKERTDNLSPQVASGINLRNERCFAL